MEEHCYNYGPPKEAHKRVNLMYCAVGRRKHSLESCAEEKVELRHHEGVRRRQVAIKLHLCMKKGSRLNKI